MKFIRKEFHLVIAMWAFGVFVKNVHKAEDNGLDKPNINRGIILIAQAISEDAEDDLKHNRFASSKR